MKGGKGFGFIGGGFGKGFGIAPLAVGVGLAAGGAYAHRGYGYGPPGYYEDDYGYVGAPPPQQVDKMRPGGISIPIYDVLWLPRRRRVR